MFYSYSYFPSLASLHYVSLNVLSFWSACWLASSVENLSNIFLISEYSSFLAYITLSKNSLYCSTFLFCISILSFLPPRMPLQNYFSVISLSTRSLSTLSLPIWSTALFMLCWFKSRYWAYFMISSEIFASLSLKIFSYERNPISAYMNSYFFLMNCS